MISIPNRKQSRPSAEINVVPYIDVMLVLLVIFMITTPILEQGVEVEIPNVNNSQVINTDDDKKLFVITIDKKGFYYHGEDKERLSRNRIKTRVRVYKEEDPNLQVMIRGDKNVAYGKVIGLVTELSSIGIEKVGFITESKDDNNN